MIKVDGKESLKKISDFSNLEELLKDIAQEKAMADRIVTDVIINDENFTEIYPHQAEDMDCDSIDSVEIRSIPAATMAVRIAGELEKVALMMGKGARSVSSLFRNSQESDALELLQDLLDVTRDLISLLSHLRDNYTGVTDESYAEKLEAFSNLISEMSEVLENEDWVLLADLLEFEYAPACDDWRKVGMALHSQLKSAEGE